MTMIILILAYFLSSLWLGYWFVVRLFEPKNMDLLNLFLCITSGLGFGLGANSLLVFLFLMLHISIVPIIFVVINLAIGSVFWFISRKMNRIQLPVPENKLVFIPILMFSILLILSVNKFLYEMKVTPFGAWDAWAIWNFHARFLYAGVHYWTRMFDPVLLYSHSDYPFLNSCCDCSWMVFYRKYKNNHSHSISRLLHVWLGCNYFIYGGKRERFDPWLGFIDSLIIHPRILYDRTFPICGYSARILFSGRDRVFIFSLQIKTKQIVNNERVGCRIHGLDKK